MLFMKIYRILELWCTYVIVRAIIKDLVQYGSPWLQSNLPVKILSFNLMVSCTIALMFR